MSGKLTGKRVKEIANQFNSHKNGSWNNQTVNGIKLVSSLTPFVSYVFRSTDQM